MSLHCNGCDGYSCHGLQVRVVRVDADGGVDPTDDVELVPQREDDRLRHEVAGAEAALATLRADNVALRRRIVELGEEMRAERGNASDVASAKPE